MAWGRHWIKTGLLPGSPAQHIAQHRAVVLEREPVANCSFQAGFLRGGGGRGGSRATDRKCDEKLLEALSSVLSQFRSGTVQDSDGELQLTSEGLRPQAGSYYPPSGQRRQPKAKRTLLQALTQLCDQYRAKPQGDLLQQLEQLVLEAREGRLSTEAVPPAAPEPVRKVQLGTPGSKGSGKSVTWAEVASGQPKPAATKPVPAPSAEELNASSWPPGAIMQESRLLAVLEAGKTPGGTVAWVTDAESVVALRELAQVHKVTKAFALLTTETVEGARAHQFAVKQGSKGKVLKLHAVALSSELPPLPAEPVVKSKSEPTEVQLTTFRICIPEACLSPSQWAQAQKSPGKAALELCGGDSVHSTYGWLCTQHKGPPGEQHVLEGYLRVSPEGAAQVQKASGKAGVFAKPLASEQSPYVTFPVQWCARKDKETSLQYFDRVPACLAVGWRRIPWNALHADASQPPPEVPSAWTLSGAPRWWRESDVSEP